MRTFPHLVSSAFLKLRFQLGLYMYQKHILASLSSAQGNSLYLHYSWGISKWRDTDAFGLGLQIQQIIFIFIFFQLTDQIWRAAFLVWKFAFKRVLQMLNLECKRNKGRCVFYLQFHIMVLRIVFIHSFSSRWGWSSGCSDWQVSTWY